MPRKFITLIYIFFFLVLFPVLVPEPALSGTIKGIVKFTGKAPPPRMIKTGKYKKICGATLQSEELLLDGDKVRNAVVSLEGKRLKGKPGEYKLDQKGCRYVPHVLAMMKGSELEIHSSDPFNHNLHTFSFDNDPINLMFTPGQEVEQEFDEPEVVKVECDLHSWMSGWIVVTDNGYFDVSKKNGAFEIIDVPPGKYTVKVWHEMLGEQSRKVKVGDGVEEVIFEFSKINPQSDSN